MGVQGRVKDAVKRTATDLPAIITVVSFTVVMCVMASNLQDGSEAMTTLVAGTIGFFGTFMVNLFRKS